MLLQIVFIFLSIYSSSCEEDNKWVWDSNSRSNPKASARYAIYENNYDDYDDRPIGGGPGRPLGPYPNKPRPIVGPVHGGLEGPIVRPPSHHEDFDDDRGFGRPPVRKFDTCTCKESFNCPSPGISYGHCDAGKAYCCFNKHGGLELEPAPSRPIHSPHNGVLVGPGGPTGIGGKPGKYGSGYGAGYGDRYGAGGYGNGGYGSGGYGNGGPGVLVGPGGPHGSIGGPIGGGPLRPYQRPGLEPLTHALAGLIVDAVTGFIGGGRPVHSAENGILVGPGGPYDRPYGGGYNNYNRLKKSATLDDDEKKE